MVKRTITICFCLLLISNFAIVNTHAQSAATPRSDFEIIWNINNVPLEADVSPDGDGNISILSLAKCNFTFQKDVLKLMFAISATSQQGWRPTIDPSEFTLTQEHDSQEFYINLTVPLATSYYIADEVQVNGRGTYYPSHVQEALEPVSMAIRVKQYYGVQVHIETFTKKIKTGDKAEYDLNITNTGNALDSYHISVDNGNNLELSGLVLEVNAEAVELEPDDGTTVQVVVSTSGDTKTGEYNIKLSVSSEQEGQYNGTITPNEFTLTLKVEPDYTIPVTAITIVLLIVIIVVWRKRSRLK